MEKIYKVIFSQNNTKKEENYLIDLSEFEQDESIINKLISKIEFSPSQKVLDKLSKFIRES